MSATLPNTLIVGLGQTGLSCARFLSRRGVPVAVTDSRSHPPQLPRLREELPDVAVFVGGFDPDAFRAAELLVISPGVSPQEPLIAAALKRGVEMIGDIELFARHVDAPVLAITGSNGKSTVTTLVGEMARTAGIDVRVGGNLGTPALDLLSDSAPALYVLELSSFQLETTHSLNALAAVILNISADHMDRYATLKDYIAAKQRIFQGTGLMVLNREDACVMDLYDTTRRAITFGLDVPPPEHYGIRAQENVPWLACGENLLMRASDVALKGRHNLANALAAWALGAAAGISASAMVTTLRAFRGLPHRTELVAEHEGITWINDSKGTNVGATLAALQGMPGKVVLIAGGIGKQQDFTVLRSAVEQHARAVVLLGQDAALIADALADSVPLRHVQSLRDAVMQAQQCAQPGDTVLLSPACASFDMFQDYEDRGRQFSALVHAMIHEAVT